MTTFVKATSLAILSSALLAGCGTSTASAPQPIQATAAHPTTVVFWYGLGGSLGQQVQTMVAEFNRSHPLIHVEADYEGSYSDSGPLQQKLLAAIVAHRPPDVAQIEVHSMPVFAATGALAPLNQDISRSSIDGPSHYLPGMAVTTTIHGTIYGVPFNRSVPLIIYNETLFKKAGITQPPATWPELIHDAQLLTQHDGSQSVYGFAPLANWWPWESQVWSAGGHIMNKSLTQATFDSPSGEKVTKALAALIHAGDAEAFPGSEGWDNTMTAFYQGKVAMMEDSSGDLGYDAQQIGNKFAWGATMMPKDPVEAVPPGGADAVIFKNSSKQVASAAWTFIQWWTAPAQTMAWSEATGYLPVQQAVLSNAKYQQFLATHPQNKVALAELAYQKQPPQSPHYLALLQYVQDAMQSAYFTNTSVAHAMKTAAQQTNAVVSGQ
ncbi:MAG: ABC transporter substrate-binding protein [Sulfobacillus thermotolerans]|nr:ABC transporter substrate-binding protein [Sulfobacillus thermotolerans]